MTTPMLWFSIDRDLEADLSVMIDRFEEKFGRAPTVLWTRDGQAADGLEAKVDGKLGREEMYLE